MLNFKKESVASKNTLEIMDDLLDSLGGQRLLHELLLQSLVVLQFLDSRGAGGNELHKRIVTRFLNSSCPLEELRHAFLFFPFFSIY